MIAALARNRNRAPAESEKNEKREARVSDITCVLPIDSRDRQKFSEFLYNEKYQNKNHSLHRQ